MKKTFILSLVTFTAILLFTNIPSAEARRHCHGGRGPHVQLNFGNYFGNNDAYVVRRYTPIVPVATPVVVYTPQAAYVASPTPVVYATSAPVYVEEVYVAPRRPSGFAGLSFSWLFR